jgi:hypothetical protein
MNVTPKPTGPNLFKPSLLAWRANYLAGKEAGVGGEAAPAAEPHVRQLRVIRSRRLAARR